MRKCNRLNCLFNWSGQCRNSYVSDDKIRKCSGTYCSHFEDADGDEDMIVRNLNSDEE